MLSAEEHPGVFYFMVGMIVLVMSGVGLSLLVDRRLKSSSRDNAIQRDGSHADDELKILKARHTAQTRLLEDYNYKLKKANVVYPELLQQLAILHQRQSDLTNRSSQLGNSLSALEDTFKGYRAEYRQQTRTGANGEKIGTLTIRGGKEYFESVITRVTDVGIEIRHRDGIARIQAPDLDREWQDRFQWSDEERMNRIKEEQMNQQIIAPDPLAAKVAEHRIVGRPTESDIAKDKLNANVFRAQVVTWRGRIRRLSSEKAEAQSQASYGKEVSVAGSLETLNAKVARLAGEIGRARTELVIAKSHLAEFAPNDSMLSAFDPESGQY